MIFAQKKIPALALTSDRVMELMSSITHSPKDKPDLVSCEKLVETAEAIKSFLVQF
jgi:hypothetical protein